MCIFNLFTVSLRLCIALPAILCATHAIHLYFCSMTVSEGEINTVCVWQACLRVPPLHFLAPAFLNKTHRARPWYISIVQSLPQISGIWCHVVFSHNQPLSTLNSRYVFLFPREVVGIRSNRCVSPGPRGGAPTFLFADAAAPPFAGNVALKSMREKQLVPFKAPERKSPAVPHREEFKSSETDGL